MTVSASSKLGGYTILAALGLAAGLVLREPAIVILCVPFLATLIFGLAFVRIPTVQTSFELSSNRALEDDEITIAVTTRAATDITNLEIAFVLPRAIVPVTGRPIWAVRVLADDPVTVEQVVTGQRWGGYEVGEVRLRVRDQLGFFLGEERRSHDQLLRIYPRAVTIRTALRANHTHLLAGSEVARSRGDGLEFADVRPYAPGDRVRRINWRLSSRRQELFVNDYHREQNRTVVILLDTFGESSAATNAVFDQAVRGAAALADFYLERRDRVGIVSFGGRLNWLRPEMGIRQRYRIIETLIETQAVVSFADREIEVVPPQMLPPDALVFALTPLQDERLIRALLNLHARRFDLVVIEIDSAQPTDTHADNLARRIWEMERQASRDRFRHLGVPVADWSDEQALDAVIREVQAFRQSVRRPSA
ncbi:MAG TPA: DUF58 domain-containing protein [Thermomicrobiales bacterium]|nr:DUF58 domain-containing protein [Thermomicrobiales bacterium]